MTGKQHFGMAVAVSAFSSLAYLVGYSNGAIDQSDNDYDIITKVVSQTEHSKQKIRKDVSDYANISHYLRMKQAEITILKLFNTKDHPPEISGRDTLWTIRSSDWNSNKAVFDRPVFYPQDSVRLKLK